jgi:hypothetical protein
MKSYEGYCRGGPWDGKQYAHYQKTMVIETMPSYPLGLIGKIPFLHKTAGEYQHVAGQWIWHPYESSH